MKKKNVIGVDVSKETLDIVFKHNQKHIQISNDETGYLVMLNEIKTTGLSLEELHVVMEHTGLYSYPFEKFLTGQAIGFTKVPAMQIKRSMGIVRGKSDKADAKLIANFGDLHQESLKQTLFSDKINEIKSLVSLRDRCVSQKAGYVSSLKEQERFLQQKRSSVLLSVQRKLIAELEKQIEKIEEEINKLIQEEESMKKNYDFLISITGIGPVISSYMLVYTNNFKLFNDGRKFASYCGIAPFDHSSGSSLKNKSKISHLANKKIKTLLDQGAKSALQFDPEIKAYYERRTAAGKSKKSTINIVRNKLVHRMFAVIKRQSPFQKNYQQVA